MHMSEVHNVHEVLVNCLAEACQSKCNVVRVDVHSNITSYLPLTILTRLSIALFAHLSQKLKR